MALRPPPELRTTGVEPSLSVDGREFPGFRGLDRASQLNLRRLVRDRLREAYLAWVDQQALDAQAEDTERREALRHEIEALRRLDQRISAAVAELGERREREVSTGPPPVVQRLRSLADAPAGPPVTSHHSTVRWIGG